MIEIFKRDSEKGFMIPYIHQGVSAGFPSPAMDFEDLKIDLNTELVKHPLSTYYGRVKGVSMRDAGIDDGDLLIIDKSIEPSDGKIAVCFLDGEFTAKRIRIKDRTVMLCPENEAYQPIIIGSENDFVVWGIVTHVIKSFK
jgi:DNA polymerase V